MNKKTQSGSIHLIAIVIVAVVFIGTIGFIFWRNSVQQSKMNDPTTADTHTPIPTNIIKKADQIVISMVGNEFFNKNITVNQSRSEYIPAQEDCIKGLSECSEFQKKAYYTIIYDFSIPEKTFIKNEMMSVIVDNKGNYIAEAETYGIPNCVQEPSECVFSIDKEKAIEIADGAGLEKGESDWSASFTWSTIGYVWNVKNYFSKYNGQTVMIDANTGELIGDIDNWSISIDRNL